MKPASKAELIADLIAQLKPGHGEMLVALLEKHFELVMTATNCFRKVGDEVGLPTEVIKVAIAFDYLVIAAKLYPYDFDAWLQYATMAKRDADLARSVPPSARNH
jgi:hypothetical protein